MGQITPPQGSARPVKSFTLDQAINYALANYPSVRAAMEEIAAARSGKDFQSTYISNLSFGRRQNPHHAG